MYKLRWRWKVKISLMKKGYYLAHEECPVYVPLGDNRTWFDSLGNGISLHWNKCSQTPFSVKVWSSNNGLVWKQSVNASWPNMIAHLLICPGSRARARDPWLPDFWLQQGQEAQHANMWRLSTKLWITNSLHLLNVCVCSGNAAKALLTSMMVDKKHCCQLSEGKKHKHPGNSRLISWDGQDSNILN